MSTPKQKAAKQLPKSERRYKYWYVCSGIGWLFSTLGLACVLISFLTDHWIHYEVARDDLERVNPTEYGYTQAQFDTMFVEDSRFFTRERGMFRTCYYGNETFEFKESTEEDKDDNCLRENGYDYEKEFDSPKYEDFDFDLRRILMRCHLAFYAIAIAGLGFSVVLAMIGCFCRWFPLMVAVLILCFLAALGLLLGMVFFHYYTYIEENNMDFDTYERKSWHQEPFLVDNTEANFEYSFILGWVAFACAFIAFIVFAFAAWGLRRRKIEYVKIKNKPKPKPIPIPLPMVQHIPVPAPQPPPPEPIYVQVPKPVYYPIESTAYDPVYGGVYGGVTGGNPYDPYDARY